MKFSKSNNKIYISDMNDREIISFLKLNVRGKFHFFLPSSGELLKSLTIQLKDRLNVNGQNMIISNKDIMTSYGSIVKQLRENLESGIVKLEISQKSFADKEPLLMMMGKIKEALIETCTLIDYDKMKNIFTITNKPFPNGNSDKIYYFEDNDSILVFGKEGPSIISGKTNSIEDLICG